MKVLKAQRRAPVLAARTGPALRRRELDPPRHGLGFVILDPSQPARATDEDTSKNSWSAPGWPKARSETTIEDMGLDSRGIHPRIRRHWTQPTVSDCATVQSRARIVQK